MVETPTVARASSRGGEAEAALAAFAEAFDRDLARFLDPEGRVPGRLVEAVRYSALAPGKRIRPFLTVEACRACGGSARDALPPAAAVECIHAFSLVHDDLPALDNDDYRRGRPTNHKRFGEATAILAGDALFCLAFEIIAEHVADPERSRRMTLELARAAGWAGMIGGQAADVEPSDGLPTLGDVEYIHDRKTASLFAACCRLGAIAADAEEADLAALGEYGRLLGRAFQIADDLLDVTSSARELGKAAGKDAAAGKATYPGCVGVEESRRAAMESADRAAACVERFGERAGRLIDLTRFVVERAR